MTWESLGMRQDGGWCPGQPLKTSSFELLKYKWYHCVRPWWKDHGHTGIRDCIDHWLELRAVNLCMGYALHGEKMVHDEGQDVTLRLKAKL